jgi:L-alanine-DL-glutamate epimerase-like enolase superfamily enzyme
VNHTFTSQLALAASLTPYASAPDEVLCEYPVAPSALAVALTTVELRGDAGLIRLPEAPGLGIEPDTEALAPYLKQVEIVVDGRVLYRTPELVR